MSNNIHTGLNPARLTGTNKPASTNKQETEQPTNQAPATAVKDEVKVTDQAARLQQLEGDLKTVPNINEKLVAEVRTALADGSLDMDMEETAQKLVEMESNRRTNSGNEDES